MIRKPFELLQSPTLPTRIFSSNPVCDCVSLPGATATEPVIFASVRFAFWSPPARSRFAAQLRKRQPKHGLHHQFGLLRQPDKQPSRL